MQNTHAHVFLTNPVVEKPVWIRLPAPRKKCPYTGLCRTTLLELCAPCQRNGFQPPVISKVLVKRGAIRGIRLVNYDSLLSYLDNLPSDAHGWPIPKSPEKSLS